MKAEHAYLTDEQKQQFVTLAGRLSPENIAADGECSLKQRTLRYRQLKHEWHELEKHLMVRVTEEDAWGWAGDKLSTTPVAEHK
jgi:hypothetical protein